jgi:hypothetical protein
MIDARRRGNGGTMIAGDYVDVDMTVNPGDARHAPEKSKQLHSDTSMQRMQTAFLVLAVVFAVGMAVWMIAATIHHQKHPRPHHKGGHLRGAFRVKGHKLKRRLGVKLAKKGHHKVHSLQKHLHHLKAGKKGRHRLPKRHRPRHTSKKFDLKKLAHQHKHPHNFMEAQAMRLDRMHKDHKHHDLEHRKHKSHGAHGSGEHKRKLTKFMKEHLAHLAKHNQHR